MPNIQAEQHCINESTTVTEVIEEPKIVNTHTEPQRSSEYLQTKVL